MNKKKFTSGFTIIESLVAISILVISILAALSAAQSGLSSYIYSKNQITAFYLAQEGFEQIRSIRDQNSLNNVDWLAGIAESSDDPCYFGEACIVSPVESDNPTLCPGGIGTCPKLRQDPVSGFFGYNSAWPETVFRREIQVESINPGEASITVIVDWSKGLITRQFKAKENILSWQRYQYEYPTPPYAYPSPYAYPTPYTYEYQYQYQYQTPYGYQYQYQYQYPYPYPYPSPCTPTECSAAEGGPQNSCGSNQGTDNCGNECRRNWNNCNPGQECIDGGCHDN